MNKTKEELLIELSELQQKLKVIEAANTSDISINKLWDSDERYHYLFENNPQPMWIYDIDSLRFLEINNAAIHHYGYSKDEFLAMTIKDIRPEEDIEALKKDIAFTHQPYNLAGEWRHLKKNGEIIFVDIISHELAINNRKARHVMVNDITERKKAAEILKESHALIKIAGVKAKLGGWSINIGENRVRWSDEVAAIHEMPLGYSPRVEEGVNFYAPKWRGKISKAFTNCVNHGIAFDEEMKIITASGKRVWVNVIGEAVKDDQGKVVKVQGAIQDISERKLAEESLRLSEENLAITLNSIGDGVIATDLNGLVVNMNPVAEKLCGWPLIDAAGKPLTKVFNIVNADTREIVINPVKKVLENGEIVGLANHTVLIAKNGIEYQISDSAAPIKNKEGKISGVVLVFSDVTEKYLTEQSLIENEERLNLFFNQSLTGFFFMMIDEPVVWNESVDKEKTIDNAIVNLRVTKVNQAMLDQYLATEDQFIDRTLNEFFAHDLKQGRKVIRNLFDKGTIHIDTSELRSDGTQVWIEGDYICLYDSKGSIKGLFGTQQDITERKISETTLLAKMDELERFHKLTVGREIAMVALKKEVNNLLNKLGQDNKYKIVE